MSELKSVMETIEQLFQSCDNDSSLPMIDILHILEKLNIITSIDQWDKLREIRNIIAHEYPTDITERVENIQLALDGYKTLKIIFQSFIDYAIAKKLFGN